MKKIILVYLSLGFVFIFMIMYHGCSELKDNLVMSPALGVHPEGWLNTSDQLFHGKIKIGRASCRERV